MCKLKLIIARILFKFFYIKRLKDYSFSNDVSDKRDFRFSEYNSMSTNLQEKIDLREFCSPIEDQKNLGSCHDDQTEVLTEDGWKLFNDISYLDKLASVDPVSSTLIYENPQSITKYFYHGNMVLGKHKSVDFKVTPNHKMLIRKWKESERTLSPNYDLINAEDIGWYSGLMSSINYSGEKASTRYLIKGVPDHKYIADRHDWNLDMRVWLQFLGLFIAEGTMLRNSENLRNNIQIAAFKDREKNFARKIFTEMGISYIEYEDRFRINNVRLHRELEKLGFLGTKAPYKSVPKFVFQQSAENIESFLYGFAMGDGYISSEGSRYFYTSSKQLKDDIQRLIFLKGGWSGVYVGKIKSTVLKDGRRIIGKHTPYTITEWRRPNLSLNKKKDIKNELYSGYVYCAEVPTHHTLVTRRNDKILISGNCVAQALVGNLEFLTKKSTGNHIDLSRLFVYYTTRLFECTEKRDAGSQIRDGIKVLKKYGVCREELHPHIIENYAVKPSSEAFKDAENHKITKYYKIETLDEMLQCLNQGYPFVASLRLYSSINDGLYTGIIPTPTGAELPIGRHAIMFCGYDLNAKTFLIRNSWGTDVGMSGYFTLSFEYAQQADDCWTIRS